MVNRSVTGVSTREASARNRGDSNSDAATPPTNNEVTAPTPSTAREGARSRPCRNAACPRARPCTSTSQHNATQAAITADRDKVMSKNSVAKASIPT